MLQALSILKTPNGMSRRSGESLVFFLHYRATFLMLVAACLLVSTQELFGDRIQCNVDSEADVRPEVVNAYCWAAATYSVSSAYYKEMGIESPHPGIGASEDQSEYVYRNYYQYMHLVLFMQALLFYLPHLMWKGLDGHHLDGFFNTLPGHEPRNTNQSSANNTVANCIAQCSDVESSSHDHNKGSGDHSGNSVGNCTKPTGNQWIVKHFEEPALYLKERWGTHTEYALKYLTCEMLSVINLIVQCYCMDLFLQGEFLGLGHMITPYFQGHHLDTPVRIFPLVTSCYLKKFGAPGFVDTVDALCVLPTNALNAKIFMFMWFWFAFLMALSLASVVDLLACRHVPPYRTLFIRARRFLGLRNRISQEPLLKVLALGDFGDWFVLACIQKNMDPIEFSRLMEVLHFKMKIETVGIETKEA